MRESGESAANAQEGSLHRFKELPSGGGGLTGSTRGRIVDGGESGGIVSKIVGRRSNGGGLIVA